MLETLIQNLKIFPLSRTQPDLGSGVSEAAVLVILCGPDNDPRVMLTQRSDNVSHHRGEVAFPGGMWEDSDRDLLATALRETHEEVGLQSDWVKPLATLPKTSPTRRPIVVTPFVASMLGEYPTVLQPAETAAVFRMPIRHLMEVERYDYFEATYQGDRYSMPYIDYDRFRIWGFTLRVLVDMLNASMAVNIRLHYPERHGVGMFEEV